MADKKISALTGATTPLAGTEVLPIVQSGATVKVSVDNLTAGKTVYAKNVDLTAGRLFLDQDYQITWRNGATNRGRIYIDSGNTIGFESGASNTPRMLIDSSGNATISTGNLVIGTSGKGVVSSTGTNGVNIEGVTLRAANFTVSAGATVTVTISGVAYGTATVSFGGYASAAQGWLSRQLVIGGYQTSSLYDVTTLVSNSHANTVLGAVTKGASSVTFTITNNGSTTLQANWRYEYSGQSGGVTITVA